ncbi:hypothetical protein FCV25MIE_15018 [Fagus crenata]
MFAGVTGWLTKTGAEMGSRAEMGSGSEGIGPKREGSGWIKGDGDGPGVIRVGDGSKPKTECVGLGETRCGGAGPNTEGVWQG